MKIDSIVWLVLPADSKWRIPMSDNHTGVCYTSENGELELLPDEANSLIKNHFAMSVGDKVYPRITGKRLDDEITRVLNDGRLV